jgi:hypothetical protein
MKVRRIAIYPAAALTLRWGPLRYRRMDRARMFTSTAKPDGFHARSSLTWMARLFSLVVAAMVTVLIPGISNATIWNDVTDFSSSNPSGAWRYGDGITGTPSFFLYTAFSTACDGFSGVSCWQPPPADVMFGVPVVGINTTGSTLDFATVVLPTDVLWVHPGVSTDSIVQWTAPAAGIYSISGFFEMLDTAPPPQGHPVFVGIYDNSTPEFGGSLFLPRASPPDTPGQKDPFSLTLSLNAGDVISFGVNNGGSVFFDSTGLAATITTVPEPTSLSLFASGLAGFWWLRKRRSRT